MKTKHTTLALVLFAASLGSAQQNQQAVKLEGPDDRTEPIVVNGKVEAVAAASNLQQQVDGFVKSAKSPAWIGYAVAAPPQRRLMCCFDNGNWKDKNCCTGCKLEKGDGSSFFSRGGTCVSDQESSTVFVVFRAEQGELTKIRLFSTDCGVDVSGTSLRWIQNVTAKQSLALLDALVQRRVDNSDSDSGYFRKVADNALAAISMHADAEADRILEKYIMSEGPRKVREQALFWAGMERGRKGFELVRNFARNGKAESKVREHATFVLSQSKEDEAVTELIDMAKKDADYKVRGQAIFWLGQKAGRKAAAAISDLVENDPDTYVKKKAVFALSQMPKDEGVPRLINVARSHKNAAVRKDAMFWLSQTNDPRALQFFEEILTKQ